MARQRGSQIQGLALPSILVQWLGALVVEKHQLSLMSWQRGSQTKELGGLVVEYSNNYVSGLVAQQPKFMSYHLIGLAIRLSKFSSQRAQ